MHIFIVYVLLMNKSHYPKASNIISERFSVEKYGTKITMQIFL